MKTLSKRYGIMTPYTSYLIVEEGSPESRMLEEAGGLPEPARFLEKPGTIEQFLAVVDELIDHFRAARR